MEYTGGAEIRPLFDAFEHWEIGDMVRRRLKDQFKILTLPNGVKIKFEQIIALAGDFYGLPERPIVDPFKDIDEEDSGRFERFRDAYDTLAQAPRDELQKELDKLLATLEEEIKRGRSVDPQTWDETTGGKWFFGLPVKEGRMMHLAENNHDHFLPYAKDAYLTGHQLAINKAREAGKHPHDSVPEKSLLFEAFSMEAFACHFLTDSFASGHIRTPRVELGKATILGKDGHLLSKYMHDEDNNFGLRVTNMRGDKWITYGDGMLLKEESRDNLKIVTESVQNSVDQVCEAYINPNGSVDTSKVTDLIPFVDRAERNNFPMFQIKNGKMHRRSDLSNLQDTTTTTSWWGPTTVVLLLAYKPGNSAI